MQQIVCDYGYLVSITTRYTNYTNIYSNEVNTNTIKNEDYNTLDVEKKNFNKGWKIECWWTVNDTSKKVPSEIGYWSQST